MFYNWSNLGKQYQWIFCSILATFCVCLVWSTPQIVLWKAMVLWRMELHSVSSGCPILKGLLKIHISVSSIASFHSAGCRQQVLATAWSYIWLMEAHSPGTYWCLTPALLKDDSWARRLCLACWTPCSLICALPTRENWAPVRVPVTRPFVKAASLLPTVNVHQLRAV